MGMASCTPREMTPVVVVMTAAASPSDPFLPLDDAIELLAEMLRMDVVETDFGMHDFLVGDAKDDDEFVTGSGDDRVAE